MQDNSLLKENYIIIDAQALMRNMFSKEFSNRLCSFSSAFDLLFGYETSATAENEAKLFAELLRRLKKEYGLKTIKEIEKYWVI